MGFDGALGVDLIKLLKDARKLVFGQAQAAVPHLKEQPSRPGPTGHHHPSVFGVTNGVADQVSQDAFQMHRIRVCDVLLTIETQGQTFFEGSGLKGQSQPGE